MPSIPLPGSIFFFCTGRTPFPSVQQARLCRLLLSFEAQSPPPLTQKDMAALIGVTQETLCRLLFSLRERGIVGKRENGRIPLLDIDRLCALSRMETTLLPKEKTCPPLLPPRNAVWNS